MLYINILKLKIIKGDIYINNAIFTYVQDSDEKFAQLSGLPLFMYIIYTHTYYGEMLPSYWAHRKMY